MKINIDIETYSEIDLTKVGVYKYSSHPSTEIVLAAYSVDGAAPEIWDCTDPYASEMPAVLRSALENPICEVHAFNANFERVMLWRVWGMKIPTSRWYCSMVKAWSLSFSGGLAQIGDRLGISGDQKKTKNGRTLVMKFCKPAPKGRLVERYDRENSPQEWAEYKDYCKQDVVAEASISDLLARYPTTGKEREAWLTDQDVLDAGIPVDVPMAEGAMAIFAAQKVVHAGAMEAITGVANPRSVPQISEWLASQGRPVTSLDKKDVKKMLAEEGLPDDVRSVLQHRVQLGSSPPSKYKALVVATEADGRLRGVLAFAGAQRTQRWAGRIFQPQNLARPTIKKPEQFADIITTGSRDLLELAGGMEVNRTLSSCIRSAIRAPEGKRLVVSDLSSVESRVAGYVTGCARTNRVFAEGKDTYKDFATTLFDVPYDEVTKSQRNDAKPAVLGCFAAGTLTLARRGWVPIEDILLEDEVWDGENWVKHTGVIPQGTQKVVSKYGIVATPSHPILTAPGQWTPWIDLDGSKLLQALDLASGPYYDMTEAKLGPEALGVPTFDVTNAGPNSRFTVLSDRGPIRVHNSVYGLGAKGLKVYAEGFGMLMSAKRCQEITDAYRTGYPAIKACWTWLMDAAKLVIAGEADAMEGYTIRMTRDENFLFVKLPSGRSMAYYQPEIRQEVPPWEEAKRLDAAVIGEVYHPTALPAVTYMGMDQNAHQWMRISTHGGKMLENIVQAVSRDLLSEALVAVRKGAPWMELVLHVHDEIVCVADETVADKALVFLDKVLQRVPDWAPGLLLGSKGYVSERYKK